jgi:hypothetical protein
VSARVFLARLLWLQGFSDQAVPTAEMSIGEAQATGHAFSVCYALAWAACPIALWVGNLAAAVHYAGVVLDHSRKHGLASLWRGWFKVSESRRSQGWRCRQMIAAAGQRP